MRKIDIVNNYFKNLLPDFNEFTYCPSYFELKDWDNYKECDEEGLHCKECWNQEAEENKDNILKVLWKLNNINRSKIKDFYKKERELLDKIQELCPHKNTYSDFDEDDFEMYPDVAYRKCNDCGVILR